MKRTFIFSLIFMIALTASNVLAQRAGSGPDKDGRARFQQAKDLNLTDEQKTQVDELRLEHQKEVMPLRDEMRSLQNAYKLLVIDDKVSESKLKKHQASISALRETIALKKSEHQRQVRSLLTDEQKVKFDQHVISGRGHKGSRGQRSGAMRQDKRPGNRQPKK